MKRSPSVLLILSALTFLSLFKLPLWRITLQAPQYPDGISLYIWINKLGGMEPGVLQNINILNHYVGMQRIEPESIPELTYFPYIIMGFIALAIISAIVNKKWLYLAFVILILIVSALGLYDFYLWEYDYGHNLDQNAPMVFEGVVYQPPLIGTKTLLNFIASSYPASGGYLYFSGIIFSILALIIKWKQK